MRKDIFKNSNQNEMDSYDLNCKKFVNRHGKGWSNFRSKLRKIARTRLKKDTKTAKEQYFDTGREEDGEQF